MKRRSSPNRTLWRKGISGNKIIKEWSRMLHKWWKRDVMEKIQFKKEKYD